MTTDRIQIGIADGVTVAQRNLIRMRRSPEVVIAALVQPLVMILLFGYVFGGSIDVPGGSYREFLVGGIFALMLTFSASFTGTALAEDMQSGLMNRFRILPMSRQAVVFGRTLSDVVLNAASLLLMAVTGFVIGWTFDDTTNALLAFALLLLFSHALAWVMAYLGLKVGSVSAVTNTATMVIFPATFIANTLVPAENLPAGLRGIAEWNPVSAITQATRELFGNIPPETPAPAAWSLQHPVLYSLLWTALLIAVFAPLAIRQYGRR